MKRYNLLHIAVLLCITGIIWIAGCDLLFNVNPTGSAGARSDLISSHRAVSVAPAFLAAPLHDEQSGWN